ncbi:MAG: hypothetical protein LRY20_01220 [Acholeplasmataceae bacterium]|nr:hypothetical protein [Acholeplasmataceae bacterium]
MLTLLKRFKKLIIVLIFPYLYVLFLLIAPTNQQILAPGGLTPVQETVAIEGITMSSQFHTIYVYNYYPMTPFQGFLASLGDRMDVYPYQLEIEILRGVMNIYQVRFQNYRVYKYQ